MRRLQIRICAQRSRSEALIENTKKDIAKNTATMDEATAIVTGEPVPGWLK